MEDSQGNVYNVKVCPGYVPMAAMAGRHWGRAGKAFGEYGAKRTYADLYRASKEVVEWSSRDCLWRWGIKGAGKAWYNHFRGARQIVNRRAFGWIFAYPLALCTATVESSFRVVTGVPVGLCGNAIGVVAVPAVGVTWPTVKGVAEVAVPGTALPVAGTAWNTVGTPVLALAGQRPAPSRVDGYFVKMTPREWTPEELAALVKAATELNPVAEEFAKQQARARTDWNAKFAQMHKDLAAQEKQLQRDRDERVCALLAANPRLRETLARLFREGRLQGACLDRDALAPVLQGTGLKWTDVLRTLQLLGEHPGNLEPKNRN